LFDNCTGAAEDAITTTHWNDWTKEGLYCAPKTGPPKAVS
jgi:hypothetical protein